MYPTDKLYVDPTNLQEITTTLLEIKSTIEENKANADAEFLIHIGKITQLESKAVENADNNQEHGAKISALEKEITENVVTVLNLNITLENLVINISSNEDAIKNHQTRIGDLETNKGQSIAQSVNNSISKLEASVSDQGRTIQDFDSSIKQREALSNDTLQKLDERISKLEFNMTTDKESQFEAIEVNQQRISELQSNNNATNSLYEHLELRLNFLEGNNYFIRLLIQDISLNRKLICHDKIKSTSR